MPTKALKTRTSKSPTRTSSGRAAGTAVSPRAATGRAASPRAVSPRAATPRAATPRAATGRAASPRAATGRAAFAAAVAAKDTNRFHNLPEDLQITIMKMARKKNKVAKLNKHEIYERINKNRQVFIDWLDEIKRDGVDDKKRVRNPLHEGGLIYTDKEKGLYPILYNLCFQVLQGGYDYRGVPRPVKIFYKRLRAATIKVKSPDSPPLL